MSIVRLYNCPYFINGECSLRSHDDSLIDFWNNKYLAEPIIPHCPKNRAYCHVDVDTDKWSKGTLELIRILVKGWRRNNGNADEIIEIIEQILRRQDDMKDSSSEALCVSRKWFEEKQAEARQEGREEAWDLARRITVLGEDVYTNEELGQAFGSCNENKIFNLPPDEAIEKYRAYQKKKEELHVGDEVEFITDASTVKGYIVNINLPTFVRVLTKERGTYTVQIVKCKKTGNVNEDLIKALNAFDS